MKKAITKAIKKTIDGNTYDNPSKELHWVASTLNLRKISDILEAAVISVDTKKIENIGNFKNAGA